MILTCLIIGLLYWFFALFIPAFIAAWNNPEESTAINKYIGNDGETDFEGDIKNDITHLEIQIEGYKNIESQLYKRLSSCTEKEKIIIERQRLQLDNKIYTLEKKKLKLLEKLE